MSELFESPMLLPLDADRPDPLAAPIVVRNAPEQIVERLATAVALGVYVPGQRLPAERELAEMLAVSRSTVREALRRLTDAGYVEQRRGRFGGSYVLAGWRPSSADLVRRHLLPQWSRFEALFDTRQLIEPVIAATAARRRTPADVEEMTSALAAYRDADDREASRLADERLHHAVAKAAHNPVLLSLSTQIRSRVSLGLGAEPYTEQVRRTAAEQHGELIDAIVSQHVEAAVSVASVHFVLSEALVRDLVARVSAESDPS
jgi:GntR family transcriptional regulator, transcriptional repressor for pyruvate dehydrogenase complex